MELPNTHTHTYGIHTHTHAHTQKKKKDNVERLEKKGGKKSRKNQNKKRMGGQERIKEGKKQERTKRNGRNEGEKWEQRGEGEKKKGKKKKQGGGWVLEERGYWGGQDLILITLDRHECFSVFHHLQKDKQRKQRHLLKLGKKRQKSSKRNYYIISPRELIKAIIIIKINQEIYKETIK